MAVVSNTLNSQPRPHVSPLGNFRNLQKKFMMPLCCILVAMMLYSTGGNTTGPNTQSALNAVSPTFARRHTSSAFAPEVPRKRRSRSSSSTVVSAPLTLHPSTFAPTSTQPSPQQSTSSPSYKPSMPSVFESRLVRFFQPKAQESCRALQSEMMRSGCLDGIFVSNLIDTIGAGSRDKDWTQKAEKDCTTAMRMLSNSLNLHNYGEFNDNKLLLNYMDRMMQCYVDEDNNRTIIQNIVQFGLSKCLKTTFAQLLFSGNAEFTPSLQLDLKGNTLIHLAVLSDTTYMWKDVYESEISRSRVDPINSLNTPFWLISALLHKNNEGKTPREIATASKNRDETLKQTFRSFTQFFTGQARQLGATSAQIRAGFDSSVASV